MGGQDVDHALIIRFIEWFKRDYREENDEEEPRINPSNIQTISLLFQRATFWQYKAEFNVNLEDLYHEYITGEFLEETCKPVFNQVLEPIKILMAKIGLANDDFDNFLYVGGSSRIPAVQRMLKEYFPYSKHDSESNPQEIADLGAA